MLGENEFSWTPQESVDVQFQLLVSLHEQQFVDSVSQRADELKPPGRESATIFPELPFLFRTELEHSTVLMSQLYLYFFEFMREEHA